jgi:transcriptional regulator with XRE-family HTH domain
VLAGLVGMSPSWLKGIECGTRLPPRLPLLVKLAEALAVGDVAVLAGIDMDLGGATSVPVSSFARVPHDAVPAIREAVRDPLLVIPAGPLTWPRWRPGRRTLGCRPARAGQPLASSHAIGLGQRPLRPGRFARRD